MRYIKRLLELDYRQMFRYAKIVKKRSGRSLLWIIYDMFRCSRQFGSGYVDYCNFHFEELSDELKGTYVTRIVNDGYCRKLNDPALYDLVNDKPTFLEKYHAFAKRDFLDLRKADEAQFETFCHHHPSFIVKPVDQLCGKGVEKVFSQGQDLKALYEHLKTNQQYLLEELIIQDPVLAAFNPSSINTIRVVTIVKGQKVYTPFIAFRIGRKDSDVDNFNHGGLNALVNETGLIFTAAVTKDEKEYAIHPDSQMPIKGFQIPHFDEVLKFAKELALVNPGLGYVGWDLCLSEDKGVVAIEGNHLPGYDLYQCYAHRPANKEGKKPLFDSIIENG